MNTILSTVYKSELGFSRTVYMHLIVFRRIQSVSIPLDKR